MKTAVYLLFTAVTMLACNPADREAVPADLLYRKWKLIETKNNSGDWKAASDDLKTVFYEDGRIGYEAQDQPCCVPVQVERQQNLLKVTKIVTCPNAACRPTAGYRIVSLTADELILEVFYNTTDSVSGGLRKYSTTI